MEREKTYKTKQKKIILEYLKGNSNKQLSAQEIYHELSKKENKIGLTTVYRNLEKLENEGLIKKYFSSNFDESLFQYLGEIECRNHYHLKCEKCMKVIHLSDIRTRELKKFFDTKCKFNLDINDVILNGTCEKCSNL